SSAGDIRNRHPSTSRSFTRKDFTFHMAKKAEIAAPAESQADTAHRRLEEMIVTLQLPPGSHWSEEGLAERIGIGRTPVREAVKRLQADYLVSILPRHGLMITEINTHEQLLVI